MPIPFGDEFRDGLFFAFRIMAAVGGFIAGWLLAGPVMRLLWRVAFHRPVTQSVLGVSRWAGGLLLALIIFLSLPLGWGPGGGGSGRGGGTGEGVGPHAENLGPGETGKKGTAEGAKVTKSEPAAPPKKLSEQVVLVVEILGGEAVRESKYYLIDRKSPPVDAAALAKLLDERQPGLLGIDIVLTPTSVGESHQAVRQLQSLAQDRKLRTLIITPNGA